MITPFRAVPIHVHTALEVLAAPLLMVAPLALGFTAVAGIISFTLGVLLMGLALAGFGDGQRGSIPLNAHAGMDVTLAVTTVVAGILVGVATGDVTAAAFMAGFGAAHLALIASTRFSRPLGA